MSMYLVDSYKKVAADFADAGMDVVFTGHMHAIDIAAVTTKKGNTLYDIETGSAVTYPSPIRFIELSKKTKDGKPLAVMQVETKTHLGPFSYTNPPSNTINTIEDLTLYGKEQGFTVDMLQTLASTSLSSFLDEYLKVGEWTKI